MKEVQARVNSYRSGPPGSRGDLGSTLPRWYSMPALISSGVAGGNEARPWRPANNIDITLPRRDPREPVSSLLSAMVGSIPDLPLSPAGSGYSRSAQTGAGTGTEGQEDHYRNPRSVLREEGAGRSRAISDTPSICIRGGAKTDNVYHRKHEKLGKGLSG